MAVIIKGIDLSAMIDGGTYSQKKTIGQLSNFPSGTAPFSSWVYPNAFGIIVNGADICNQYTAKYADHTSSTTGTFPSWYTSFKVICIGGGGGGSGWTAPINNDRAGSYAAEVGTAGSNGGISSGRGTGSGTYSVTIGSGGAGGTTLNAHKELETLVQALQP